MTQLDQHAPTTHSTTRRSGPLEVTKVGGHLGASEPRDPPFAIGGEPGIGRGDLGSPRDEELADLVTVVHDTFVHDSDATT